MPVTDDQVETLRALLAGDLDEYRRRLRQLDSSAAQIGLSALVAAGFFEAVDRRFAKEDITRGEIVEFVGDVRARSETGSDEIDPRAAERLILHSLGEGSIEDLDDETVVGTQIVLLGVLAADEQLDEGELDAFVREVRAVADEWTN